MPIVKASSRASKFTVVGASAVGRPNRPRSRKNPHVSWQIAGNAGYWDSEQVFNGHVLGFTCLEHRAVGLVVNDQSEREPSGETTAGLR